MNTRFAIALLLIVQCSFVFSQPGTAIPKADIRGPFVWKSKIYPGTERNYWIYVPKQYDAAKPACTLIVQDGLSRATGWNLPAVLDSLIALKEIPVIIGIFIDHGTVPANDTSNYPRFNRSFEYDALGDRYARFLLQEILPEISRSFNLSTNPDDRSIAGASSGAICAFNAAWERPDAFHRVLSTIGTYVGLRGGDEFATLVRKTESKPLRVFLEDSDHDLNIYAGDWWMANQDMLSALTWAGYEVNHAWGDGGHDSRHTITILADALKWLWKNYPAPVQTHKGTTPRLNLLIEGEIWKEIRLNDMKIDKLAINKAGEVFFANKQSIYKTGSRGNVSLFAKLNGEAGGISFHNDGKLYVADLSQHKIVSIGENGIANDAVKNVNANFLSISGKGIYFTETNKNRIGFYSFSKKNVQYIIVPGTPTGLVITAEQTFLSVAISNSVFGYSFKIMEDGRLDLGQDYIHYHIPFGTTSPGAMGMAVDTANLLYSATAMGIQVSDQLGRVNFIFSKPADGIFSDAKLGGTEFNTLYVICNGKLYSRKIGTKGILSWLPIVKPPRPGM